MSNGAALLASDLAVATADLVEGLAHADHDAAQLLATAAQRGAPRRTGFLAGSIEATADGVTVGAPYGRVIHDGWAAHHIRARPYLADAADRIDWAAPYVDAATIPLQHLNSTY